MAGIFLRVQPLTGILAIPPPFFLVRAPKRRYLFHLFPREGAAFVSSRVLRCFPNSSVIEEDGEGLLKAGSIAGTAVLEVTSVEPFGVNQTTITGVQVSSRTYKNRRNTMA